MSSYIKRVNRLGNFKIMYATLVGQHRLILFTELMFTDFDVNLTGHSDDVKKKAFHDFLISFDEKSRVIEVKSNIYYVSIEKFQKEEFIHTLLKELSL